MTARSVGSIAGEVVNDLAAKTGRVKQFPDTGVDMGNQQVVTREEAEVVRVDESASIMDLISQAARDQQMDVDKLERMMGLYERVKARGAHTAFLAALARMQEHLPVIERKGKITIRDKQDQNVVKQSTPYALWEDINEAIKPVLAENGFALQFKTGVATDGKITVTGILSHSGGHQEETTMTLPHDSTGSKNAVQAVGSSISYGKRYTAGLLLNLTSRGEDDDGKAAGADEPISDEQAKNLRGILEETGADIALFCNHFRIEAVPELPAARYQDAVTLLSRKRAKQAARQ